MERKSPVGDRKKNYYWEKWASGDTFLIEKGAISGKLSAGDKSGPGRYAAGRGNGRETICQKMAKCPGHKNRWWQKVHIWKTDDIQGKNFVTRNLILKKFPKLRRIILPYWDGGCYNSTYILGEANTFSDKIHYRRIMRDDSLQTDRCMAADTGAAGVCPALHRLCGLGGLPHGERHHGGDLGGGHCQQCPPPSCCGAQRPKTKP